MSAQPAGWAVISAWPPRARLGRPVWLRAGGGDSEQGERAHGQHRVAVEGVPEPDLVLIESGLPFCLLVTFFHRPSLPRHGEQDAQGYRAARRGVAVEEGQPERVGRGCGGLAPNAAARPSRATPRVVAVALAAAPARAGLPRRRGDQPGQESARTFRPEPGCSRTLKLPGPRTRIPSRRPRRPGAASPSGHRPRPRRPSRTAPRRPLPR